MVILNVKGEQIIMLPSHKGNNCFIMPINIFFFAMWKKKRILTFTSQTGQSVAQHSQKIFVFGLY